MAVHLAPLLGFAVGLPSPLGNAVGLAMPLLLWKVRDGSDLELGAHAREAFNFQLNVLVWLLVACLCTCCALAPVVQVANVVLVLVAAARVADGADFRFPWIFRLMK